MGAAYEMTRIAIAPPGATGGGEGDDVAAPVGGVGSTVDLMAALEAAHDAVDVIAVQAEPVADIGLAQRALPAATSLPR